MTEPLPPGAGGAAEPRPRECFDATRAAGPTRVVPVTAIVDLLEVTHAAGRIEEYRAAMRQGMRFPPVAVVRVGRRFWIADGHKRFTAYRALGEAEIVVEVWGWRRCLEDQWRQFREKSRQQWQVLWAASVDPAGRAAARRLVGDTIGHWRRIALSWRRRARHRSGR